MSTGLRPEMEPTTFPNVVQRGEAPLPKHSDVAFAWTLGRWLVRKGFRNSDHRRMRSTSGSPTRTKLCSCDGVLDHPEAETGMRRPEKRLVDHLPLERPFTFFRTGHHFEA